MRVLFTWLLLCLIAAILIACNGQDPKNVARESTTPTPGGASKLSYGSSPSSNSLSSATEVSKAKDMAQADENIGKVKNYISIAEVIQLMGKPDEVWGDVLEPSQLLFIYKRQKKHSILLDSNVGVIGTYPNSEIEHGPDSRFRRKINVVIKGNTIEFQEK